MDEELIPAEQFSPPPMDEMMDASQFMPPPTDIPIPDLSMGASLSPQNVPEMVPPYMLGEDNGDGGAYNENAFHLANSILGGIGNFGSNIAKPITETLDYQLFRPEARENLTKLPGPLGIGQNVADQFMGTIYNPLAEAINAGQTTPGEVASTAVGETAVGVIANKLPGVGKLFGPALQSVASNTIKEYYNDPDERRSVSQFLSDSIQDAITNYGYLFSNKALEGADKLVSGIGTGAEKVQGYIKSKRPGSAKELMGANAAAIRKARGKSYETVWDDVAGKYTIRDEIDKAREVLMDMGMFDEYKDANDFLGRLETTRKALLDERNAYFAKIEDKAVNKLNNATIPEFQLDLAPYIQKIKDAPRRTGIADKYLKELQRSSDVVADKASLKQLTQWRDEGVITDETLQKFLPKEKITGIEYKRPKVNEGDIQPRYLRTDIIPDDTQRAFDFLQPTRKFDVYASDIPRSEAYPKYQTFEPELDSPTLTDISEAHKQKSFLYQQSLDFKKGPNRTAKADAARDMSIVWKNSIHQYYEDLKAAKLITPSEAKRLKDIDTELQAIIVGQKTATIPAALESDRLPTKTINRGSALQYMTDFAEKSKNQAMFQENSLLGKVRSGIESGAGRASNLLQAATPFQSSLGGYADFASTPLGMTLLNQYGDLGNQETKFPRTTQRFFDISPEVVGEYFGPEAQFEMEKIITNKGTPESKRSFVANLVRENTSLFADAPEGFDGLSMVDGIIDDEYEILEANKRIKDSNIDENTKARLRLAINTKTPTPFATATPAIASAEAISALRNSGIDKIEVPTISVTPGQDRQNYSF